MISIIVPVYNLYDYILFTLNSIKNQTSKEYELIIVNDGSTDNSKAIIEKFIMENINLKIKFIDSSNQGVSAARNKGLDLADGDYILFLDGDDVLHERAIELLLDKVKKNKCDTIFYGYADLIDDKIFNRYSELGYEFISNPILGKDALLKKLCKKIWICSGSAMYSREMILENKLRYTEGTAYGEDLEFINKCLYNSKSVVAINEELIFIRIRESSALRSKFKTSMITMLDANRRLYDYIYLSTDDKINIDNIIKVINYEYHLLRKYIAHFLFNNYSINNILEVRKQLKKYKLTDKTDVIVDYKKIVEIYGDSKSVSRVKLFNNYPLSYFLLYKIKNLINK